MHVIPKLLTIRVTPLGVVSWLVPFLTAAMMFDASGQPSIPPPLFKSLMVVVFGGLGTALLIAVFRRLAPSAATGLALGIYWLAINLALDLAVLVPLSKMPLLLYFQDIGLRYLLIPIISLGMGIVGARPTATGS
jgi:hypothetical protein